MTLHEYVMTLRRHWILIASLVVLGAIGGFVYAKTQTPLYRSTSSVLLSAERGESTADLAQGSNYIQNLVQSYTNLAVSDIVLQPVIDELGLDVGPAQLANSVSADAPLNTVVINIWAVDPDPKQAQRIDSAVTASLTDKVATVAAHGVDGKPSVRVTNINLATLPRMQFYPDSRLSAGIGGIIGLAIATFIAFIRHALSTRLTDVDDLALITPEPALGEILETRHHMSITASILANPYGIVMESFRQLAASLRFAEIDHKRKTLVVTSAQPNEGKTSVSIGLAVALAEAGQRILLIDADLRHPSVSDYTQLEGSVGLTTVLVGEEDLAQAAQQWGSRNLDVLTAGQIPPNPNHILNSQAMRAMLENASKLYDVVIMDSAPVISVTDALWLGRIADGVLLVARQGTTHRRNLVNAIVSIQNAHASLAGIVLNGAKRTGRDAKYYANEKSPRQVWRTAVAESRT